jgi:glutathione S-transferase
MPEYKLYYFPLRARAEAIRLMFHYKGIPFDDVRVSDNEWSSIKDGKLNYDHISCTQFLAYKFGKMPILEVDGKQIAHSWCILRYLEHQFGK